MPGAEKTPTYDMDKLPSDYVYPCFEFNPMDALDLDRVYKPRATVKHGGEQIKLI